MYWYCLAANLVTMHKYMLRKGNHSFFLEALAVCSCSVFLCCIWFKKTPPLILNYYYPINTLTSGTIVYGRSQSNNYDC